MWGFWIVCAFWMCVLLGGVTALLVLELCERVRPPAKVLHEVDVGVASTASAPADENQTPVGATAPGGVGLGGVGNAPPSSAFIPRELVERYIDRQLVSLCARIERADAVGDAEAYGWLTVERGRLLGLRFNLLGRRK